MTLSELSVESSVLKYRFSLNVEAFLLFSSLTNFCAAINVEKYFNLANSIIGEDFPDFETKSKKIARSL